jgi:acyl CoA:acetate/3-ketoacid CoA transferase beta subunit
VGDLALTIVPAAFLAGVGGAVIGLATGAGPALLVVDVVAAVGAYVGVDHALAERRTGSWLGTPGGEQDAAP